VINLSNQQKSYLTIEQRDEMKERLSYLTNIEIPANAQAIDEAKAQGDLSENAEYDAAKDEQAKLHAEKLKLQNILNNAAIIKENISTDFVDVGHSVTVEWSDGKIETIKLLGYGNGKDQISMDAPLGKALLGKKLNDSVTIEAPVGRLHLKVLEIA
jgi:transcription elongation factor GreA